MAKPARRYEITLPLTDNAGNLFPPEQFDALERQLLERFGGLTSHRREYPLRGLWQGGGQLFLDQVIVLAVLDVRKAGSSQFIAGLKKKLLEQFDQLEILITESPLRIH